MKKIQSPEIEEYLETLCRYAEEGRQARVKDLAGDLGISAASVSQMLKKLSEKNLIKYEKYGKIRLTKKGEEIGRSILRKHRLVEKFLGFIGVKRNVHEEACLLEHAISDQVEEAIIKTMKKSMKKIRVLAEMKNGESGIVLFIEGGSTACKRLTAMGLTPGTKIEVERESTLIGPVEISIRSSRLAVGRGLAKKIYLAVDK
ncbi:metal-dependent transcriptional regulator [Candidatus Micrarchaeota archaeon]|nr:metal-dependent transcriptional regulator [Candidatus Micrarchaeota archaeon]